MGTVTDLGVDIQAAEKEIEKKWSSTSTSTTGGGGGVKEDTSVVEVRGEIVGASRPGVEKVL